MSAKHVIKTPATVCQLLATVEIKRPSNSPTSESITSTAAMESHGPLSPVPQ